MSKQRFEGVGIGLRQEFAQELAANSDNLVDFLELAPENWMHVGGARQKTLHLLAERYPLVAHGLCLSIGGPGPLDGQFLADLKQFIEQHKVVYYSEHLSYCTDEKGYLYDLMPIPFTSEAVTYVAARIRQVQECLGRRIAMENVSYYCAPGQELSELDFIKAVLSEADCDLLLDVNNVFVNSVNHGYCPREFLASLPQERVSYVHVAGHYVEQEDLLIDTHGANVCPEVWALLAHFYQQRGFCPTLLERDNNVPALEDVLKEASLIQTLREETLEACS